MGPATTNSTPPGNSPLGSGNVRLNVQNIVQTDTESSLHDITWEDSALAVQHATYDVWEAGNRAQEHAVENVKNLDLDPIPMNDYAKERLVQVSRISRDIQKEYHELFLQRAQAKHILFEEAFDAADSQLHDPQVMAQMKRVLSITQFSLGPTAEAHRALDTIWRTLMHTAIQETQAVACTSICGYKNMCYDRASRKGTPEPYGPLNTLHPVQRAQIQALVEIIFNATVPVPPVRPPILHWDPRIDGSNGGQQIQLNHNMEHDRDTISLWIKGHGEPRQDAWQVAASTNNDTEPDSVIVTLQKQLIQHFLTLQATQLLDHIDEWDFMLEPDSIRYVSYPTRRKKGKARWKSHAASLERSAYVGETLASMLKSRLEVMSTEHHKGWDEASTAMQQNSSEEMAKDPHRRSTGSSYETSGATEDDR